MGGLGSSPNEDKDLLIKEKKGGRERLWIPFASNQRNMTGVGTFVGTKEARNFFFLFSFLQD